MFLNALFSCRFLHWTSLSKWSNVCVFTSKLHLHVFTGLDWHLLWISTWWDFKTCLDIWGSGAYRLLDVSDHCLVTTGLFMIYDVDSKSTKRDSLYINSLTLLRRKTDFPMTRVKRNFRNQTFICLMKCCPSSLKCSWNKDGFKSSAILQDNGSRNYSNELSNFLKPVVQGLSNYTWIRCFHKVEDGWDISRCLNKSHIVVILRKDNYIFGGYTSLSPFYTSKHSAGRSRWVGACNTHSKPMSQAFLLTDIFLVQLFFCERKAVPVQWRTDVN